MPPLVCIVDDDESIRESLEGLFRSVGFAAQSFHSAEAFLANTAVFRAACLVLDVSMPGMTGPELQLALAGRGSKLPVIFITARAESAHVARLMERGALACFVKPFDEEELLEAVRAATGFELERYRS